MKKPVIAIALDSADPLDVEAWADAGMLPNIDAVRRRGMYGRICNRIPLQGGEAVLSETEMLWVIAQTGCFPHKTGYWGSVAFDPGSYGVAHSQEESGFDFKDHKPFYALGEDYRVCTFDMPVANISEAANGVQITGWGGHFPFSKSRSLPAEVYPDIVRRYGENPVYLKDGGHFWDQRYADWLQEVLPASIDTRTRIAVELLQQGPWDLFLAGFGESHSAGHDLFHLSHPESPIHPEPMPPLGESPMVRTFRQIDDAIGRIFAAADPDSVKVVFSVHGITANHSDLGCFLFLPELMYRYNFGTSGFAGRGRAGEEPGKVIRRPRRNSWATNIWLEKDGVGTAKRLLNRMAPRRYLRSGSGDRVFSPLELGRGSLAWMPARWYSRSWPRMKAFSLPSFAEGHIRVNLRGRERDGIVAPADYAALLDDISDKLLRVRCARTGKPLVKDLVRTRDEPLDNAPKQPAPDLVVVWNEHATDVLDSPDFGRIGPVPYFRPGGHSNRGFVAAAGAGIPAESTFADANAADVAPTIRWLLGAEIPAEYDGQVIRPIEAPAALAVG